MIIKKGFIFQGTRSFLKLVYSLDTSSYPIIIIIIIIIVIIIIIIIIIMIIMIIITITLQIKKLPWYLKTKDWPRFSESAGSNL